jgi:hypothetical protein
VAARVVDVVGIQVLKSIADHIFSLTGRKPDDGGNVKTLKTRNRFGRRGNASLVQSLKITGRSPRGLPDQILHGLLLNESLGHSAPPFFNQFPNRQSVQSMLLPEFQDFCDHLRRISLFTMFKRLQYRNGCSMPGDDDAFPLTDPVKQPG